MRRFTLFSLCVLPLLQILTAAPSYATSGQHDTRTWRAGLIRGPQDYRQLEPRGQDFCAFRLENPSHLAWSIFGPGGPRPKYTHYYVVPQPEGVNADEYFELAESRARAALGGEWECNNRRMHTIYCEGERVKLRCYRSAEGRWTMQVFE
jgi:hypothetical protein